MERERVPYTIREDNRLNKYFEKYMTGYLYMELSEDFLKKMGIDSSDRDFKIPVLPEDLEKFTKDNGQISITKIAENMVFVAGCNSKFKYVSRYVDFIKRFFDGNLTGDLISAGVKFANQGELEKASIFFRSALKLLPDSKEAMYNYARVCRDIYMKSDEEEKIGMFKAESIDVFEELTLGHPDFEDPYYFLGYGYLNMGLYEKAGICWEKYMEIGTNDEAISDVGDRLSQIQEPRIIEKGCNLVIRGDYRQGYNILSRFASSDYQNWWPLHFYMGVASEELGNLNQAIESYKKSINLNAGNIDAIDGLIRIYQSLGDKENETKYRNKKNIIIDNFKEISIDN